MVHRLCARAVFTILTLSVASCARSGNQGGGNSNDASAPAQGSSPWAANAAEVARFSDEVPFGPAAVIAHDNTAVRTSPGGNDIVSTLAAGADVVKLAMHGNDDLVCFDEPKPGGRHVMGWVAQSALQDPAPPTPVPPSAVDGEAPPAPDPPTPHGGHHHRPHKQRHQ